MSGAEVLWAPRVLANQTSGTPGVRPPSERGGRTATGRLYPRRGARRGQGARDPARQPASDGLKLTGGHRGAGQAGVAGRCHLRASRASRLAQPRCGRRRRCPRATARSLRGPQPMAKSWGRAESTSLRTLPALPAPPDDALLPPLFICGFRPSRRLCTLLSGCRGVGGSRGRPRGGRSGLIVPLVEPQLRSALPRARLGPPRPGGPEAPRRLLHPPLGSRLPGGTSSSPGKGGRSQTDRATSPFSLRPNSARAHTKEGEEKRELGGWFSCRGLDSSCDWGWRRRLGTAGQGDARPGRETPRCWGGRRGARGERGCGAQRCSTVWRQPGVRRGEKVVGLAARGQAKERRRQPGRGVQRAKTRSLRRRC